MSNFKQCFILEPHFPLVEADGRAAGPTEGGLEASLMRHTAFDRQRKERDLVYYEILEPAVQGRVDEVIRSSERPYPERLTQQARDLSRDADLVIANLTGNDPRVFFCLAHRLATNDKGATLLVIRKEEERILELPAGIDFPITYSEEAVAAGLKGEAGREELAREGLLKARRALTDQVAKLQSRPRREKRSEATDDPKRDSRRDGDQPSDDGDNGSRSSPSGGGKPGGPKPGPFNPSSGFYEEVVSQAVEEFLKARMDGGDLASRLTRDLFGPSRG